MSDPCFLEVGIHGKIDTIEKYLAIVSSLKDSSIFPKSFDDEDKGYAKTFLNSLEVGPAPYFANPDCNYANIDECESDLQQLGVPYAVSHESGGDYGARCWSWIEETGKIEADRIYNSGPAVSVSDLKDLLLLKGTFSSPIVDGIHKIVRKAEHAEGEHLPPFSVSDEVLAHLREVAGVKP